MEALRQWGFSLCAAALACSLIRMLLPRTSLTRTLQMALSVFFLTVLIQPLWKAELAEEISIRSTSGMEEAERIAETLDAALIGEVIDKIESDVYRILEQMGIRRDQVRISLVHTESALQLEIRLSSEVTVEEEMVGERLEEEISLPTKVSKEERYGTDK